MKKWVALVLAACLLCGLCGCTAIDKMRESQAFLQADGTILWQGNTYIPVPGGASPQIGSESMIYVTAPDVPVLLSVIMAEKMCMASQDGRLLWDFEGTLYSQAGAEVFQSGSEQTT